VLARLSEQGLVGRGLDRRDRPNLGSPFCTPYPLATCRSRIGPHLPASLPNLQLERAVSTPAARDTQLYLCFFGCASLHSLLEMMPGATVTHTRQPTALNPTPFASPHPKQKGNCQQTLSKEVVIQGAAGTITVSARRWCSRGPTSKGRSRRRHPILNLDKKSIKRAVDSSPVSQRILTFILALVPVRANLICTFKDFEACRLPAICSPAPLPLQQARLSTFSPTPPGNHHHPPCATYTGSTTMAAATSSRNWFDAPSMPPWDTAQTALLNQSKNLRTDSAQTAISEQHARKGHHSISGMCQRPQLMDGSLKESWLINALGNSRGGLRAPLERANTRPPLKQAFVCCAEPAKSAARLPGSVAGDGLRLETMPFVVGGNTQRALGEKTGAVLARHVWLEGLETWA